jgi:hypothetical protein
MRLKSVLTTIFVALMLVVGIDYVSFAATGGHAILGKINKAGKTTTFQRTKAGPPVTLTAKTSSTAPLATNGRGKVANLNADILDGLDSSKLVLKQARVTLYSAPFVDSVNLPAGSTATIRTVTFTVPAECGTNTRHRYLVTHEAEWYGINALISAGITVDSQAVSTQEGYTVVTANQYASSASSRVVTLAPGVHSILLVAHEYNAVAVQAWNPALRAMDLGYSCSGGATSSGRIAHSGGRVGPN